LPRNPALFEGFTDGRLSVPAVDPEAWAEFVRRYGPMVYRWCLRWGLQEADAQDMGFR